MTAASETNTVPLSPETHETADRIVRRYPVARSALLPLLHLVQSEQNHITDEGVAFCAEKVGLTRAEVGAVATFYTMYKRQPVGDWLLSVCTNPTCKQKGGQEIYENYVSALGGHNDPETKVTVEHAECLGICDGAPVVQVNYEMFGPMTVAEGDQLLASCRKGDPPVSPWSGEKPPTFAEVERDLSGANDAWEAQLHAAALQQIAYDDPPTYRSGETDIPVTHPGGDPAGVGGAQFREEATGISRDAATPDVPEGDADQALAGDVSQRIAPGESDDTTISAAGAGAPTADEVEVHVEPAPQPEGEPAQDAPALTHTPGESDAPGDDGQTDDAPSRGELTDPQASVPRDVDVVDPEDAYADDPERDREDAAGGADPGPGAGDATDAEGNPDGNEADVAPDTEVTTEASGASGDANRAPEAAEDAAADDAAADDAAADDAAADDAAADDEQES